MSYAWRKAVRITSPFFNFGVIDVFAIPLSTSNVKKAGRLLDAEDIIRRKSWHSLVGKIVEVID